MHHILTNKINRQKKLGTQSSVFEKFQLKEIRLRKGVHKPSSAGGKKSCRRDESDRRVSVWAVEE